MLINQIDGHVYEAYTVPEHGRNELYETIQFV